jgi:hypothetical protein
MSQVRAVFPEILPIRENVESLSEFGLEVESMKDIVLGA